MIYVSFAISTTIYQCNMRDTGFYSFISLVKLTEDLPDIKYNCTELFLK